MLRTIREHIRNAVRRGAQRWPFAATIVTRVFKLLLFYIYLCAASLFLGAVVLAVSRLLASGADAVLIVVVVAVLLPVAAYIMGRLTGGTGKWWADLVCMVALAAIVGATALLDTLGTVTLMPVAGLALAVERWPLAGPWIAAAVGALCLFLMLLGLRHGRKDDRIWPRGFKVRKPR